jgi:peptide/nickel transport system permease protein
MYKFSLYTLGSVVVLISVLPFIYTVSPYALHADQILQPPTLNHIMGTDRLGRDIFARILQGGQTSLDIGILSALNSSLKGLIIGVSAGYFKGVYDKSIVVMIDLFLTFPTFFLLLTLVSYMEASTAVIIIILIITGWMGTARLIRSESFAITNKPFIKVLNLARVSKVKILLKYYTPLLMPIFLVSFTFGVGGAILAESGLSFLGLGINPPQMSWGSLLSNGKEVIQIAWWVSFFPGLFIFIITFCLMNIADHLQHSLNNKNLQNI